MCTLCAQTATFDPARHLDENGLTDPALANITETADAAADSSTAYTMGAGDTFSGDLDSAGDRDWVAIEMVAGETYSIDVLAGGSGQGTLSDSYLRLYDANGNEVANNDDGGVGYDSALTFTATTSGTFYISVGSYSDGYTGSYELAVDVVEPGPTGTLDEMADYLTDGYWNDQGFSGYQFDTSASNEITVNITNLTAEGQQLARWAFEAWEMVADLDFVEVNGTADISFDDNQSGAFAGPDSVSGGFTTTASVNVDANWLATYGSTIDSYSFSTYIHEIGHALGLGHQGDYNGSATYGVDETFANDSYQLSVMSYFSQTANTTVNASYAEPATAMMVDVIAIQNLYGAPGAASATSGNTVWGGMNSNLGTYLDDVFNSVAGGNGNGNMSGSAPVAMTIYDRGGTDTLDMSNSTTNDRINLRDGQFSDLDGLLGNLGIARGTVVERAIAGSGHDTVIGNGANNNLQGRAGNDTVSGNNGNDTLLGQQGNDMLRGGNGYDTIDGGYGNDTVLGGNGRDTAFLGNGNDSYTDTAQGGVHGQDTVYGEAGADTINGGAGDDQLLGGSQGDLLRGGTGNDTIDGGDGTDTAYLGAGDDVFNDNGQPGAFGADRVFGNGGDDLIRIRGGNDTVTGGAGEDTFVFLGNTIKDDVITDFDKGTDTLRLDDALWGGGLTRAEVIAQFADDSTGTVIFDFQNGNTITLDGISSTTGLVDDLQII